MNGMSASSFERDAHPAAIADVRGINKKIARIQTLDDFDPSVERRVTNADSAALGDANAAGERPDDDHCVVTNERLWREELLTTRVALGTTNACATNAHTAQHVGPELVGRILDRDFDLHRVLLNVGLSVNSCDATDERCVRQYFERDRRVIVDSDQRDVSVRDVSSYLQR